MSSISSAFLLVALLSSAFAWFETQKEPVFQECYENGEIPTIRFENMQFPENIVMDTVNVIKGKFLLNEDLSPDDLFTLHVHKKVIGWLQIPCAAFGVGNDCTAPVDYWHRIGEVIMCKILESFQGKGEIQTKTDEQAGQVGQANNPTVDGQNGYKICRPGLPAKHYDIDNLELEIPTYILPGFVKSLFIAGDYKAHGVLRDRKDGHLKACFRISANVATKN